VHTPPYQQDAYQKEETDFEEFGHFYGLFRMLCNLRPIVNIRDDKSHLFKIPIFS
jgi:hypothetical protein